MFRVHRLVRSSTMTSSVYVLLVAVLYGVNAVIADDNELPSLVRVDPDVVGGSVVDSWGLEDQTAFVGRLFEYQLTDKRSVINQVVEGRREDLPGWLHFDAERKVIEGVPLADDVGKTFQIQVLMDEGEDSGSQEMRDAADTFEIRVAQEIVSSNNIKQQNGMTQSNALHDDDAPRSIQCLPGTAVTTATLVIDADVTKMTGAERSRILKSIGTYLELPVSGLRLIAASASTPIDDGSALVAGAGNVPLSSTAEYRPKALVQWEVGCGNVFSAHMAVLQRVETTAMDGSMASAIGHGVIGWHVANKKPASPLRLRRQVPRVYATATPTVSIAPPTRQPVPTRTVQSPEATKVVTAPPTVATRPSTRPPKVKPTTTARLTRPPKTTKDRVQRQTTVRTTTATTSPPTKATSKATESLVPELEPSVPTKATTIKMVDVRTPPLVVTKATKFPPLTWTGKFGQMSVSVNEIVDKELPSDAFEGGAPGPMKLELLTEDGLVASLSWLKLNATSGRLYGMPMESQVGQRDYIILATDSAGNKARGTFATEVSIRPQIAYPAFESSASLDLDFDTFCENDALRLDVANKLGRAFGDPDARNLAITRVSKGSVILAWTNSTMTGDGECPDDEIEAVQSKMFNPDGTIRSSFSKAIDPYRLLGVEMTKRGSCGTSSVRATPGAAPVLSQTEASPRGGGVAGTTTVKNPQGPTATAGGSNSVIIIVFIVIAIVIIVVIIVCCIYCRRRNRNKSESPDKKIKQGAPIILAYELNDMDSMSPTPSKPLIGTGAEKPPAPPNYQLATGTNGATPSADHRQPLLASNSVADQMSPLKYQPPPGSSTGKGQQSVGSRRPPAYATAGT